MIVNSYSDKKVIRKVLAHIYFGPAFIPLNVSAVCIALLVRWYCMEQHWFYLSGALFFCLILNLTFWKSWRNKARVEALITFLHPDVQDQFYTKYDTGCLAGNMKMYELGVRLYESGRKLPGVSSSEYQWFRAIEIGYYLRSKTKWA